MSATTSSMRASRRSAGRWVTVPAGGRDGVGSSCVIRPPRTSAPSPWSPCSMWSALGLALLAAGARAGRRRRRGAAGPRPVRDHRGQPGEPPRDARSSRCASCRRWTFARASLPTAGPWWSCPCSSRRTTTCRRSCRGSRFTGSPTPTPTSISRSWSAWPMPPRKSMPGDVDLVRRVEEGVRALNAKYGHGDSGPFHLLHRKRRWNAGEGCWMGWERKRGKLAEFNRLLAGDEGTSFAGHVGDPSVLPTTRFVITLDADTELPRDAARRLVATFAHPLNRAEFDAETDRVTAGYTILQPRIEVTPFGAAASSFSRLFAGDPGLDLYARAASDVYQDLFGEGIYVGKGIYDPVAFEQQPARAGARERRAQPRSLRGDPRASGAGDRRRPLRELSGRLPRLLAASPSLGAGRLAAPPLARPPRAPRRRRKRAEPAVADLALEDHRQPSTHPASPDAARLPAARLARVPRPARRVDRRSRSWCSRLPAHRGDGRSALGEPALGPASGGPGCDAPTPPRVGAVDPARGLPAPPRGRARRRHPAHARPSSPGAPPPGVDVSGAGGPSAGWHRVAPTRSGARCSRLRSPRSARWRCSRPVARQRSRSLFRSRPSGSSRPRSPPSSAGRDADARRR